jgi:Spy/CpxP family protein refolding chaperone
MKLDRLVVSVAITALAALGQQPQTLPGIGPGLPVVIDQYSELKAYLNLTDSQLRSLEEVAQQRREAEAKIWEQVHQKQTVLDALLNDASTDHLRIGQLMVEINTLRRQLPVSGAPYRTPALAVLNPEQRTKLGALSTAMTLAPAGYQATSLNLIDSPGDVRILPVPFRVYNTGTATSSSGGAR